MACEDIGTYSGESKSFADFVISQDPSGNCQNCKVGKDSPGPVDDGEKVARFVFSPTHLKKIGNDLEEIDESLFSDVASSGSSVNRLPDTVKGIETVHERGESNAQKIRDGSETRKAQADRHYLGAVVMQAGEIRALSVDQEANRLRIYDTSKGSDDPLHADLIANMQGLVEKKKELRKHLRVALFALATKSGLYPSPLYQGPYEIAKSGLNINKDLG